jgi:tRNA 5-methylaminomethyl-2-thiouridine biosynthesis bifunctional protein
MPRDAVRYARVAGQPIWADGAMEVRDVAACAAGLGEPVACGGLWMRDAMAVRPAAVLEAWLGPAERITATVARIEATEGGWQLRDATDAVVLEAGIVVVAAGWGSAGLVPGLALAPVRGQANWVEGVQTGPVAWGGYAVPTGSGLLFGATHERGETDGGPSDEATARNLATVAARLPQLAARIAAAGPVQARTAVRATTPDRLPLAGAVPGADGLFMLGGLGSRGFCVAPLLAEHVAALATGASSPLPADLAARISPLRTAALATLAQPVGRVEV